MLLASTRNGLIPRVPSGRAIEFDFPSVLIGVAEYDEGPTGVTVFYFPNRVFGAVDVRGGAAGTMLTDALRINYGKYIDAITFAGGSDYGLEAASGVTSELLASGRRSGDWDDIPVVPSAILFDFPGRSNRIHPDKELGRAALKAAQPNCCFVGTRGAGRFVYVGKYFGHAFMERAGQGCAFMELGETKLLIATVVNARGVILDRQRQVIRGNRNPQTGARRHVGEELKQRPPTLQREKLDVERTQLRAANTTLTLLVTNEELSYSELQHLAIQTHSSMARAIEPFHTCRDGDSFFAVTTAEVRNSAVDCSDLAIHAAELAWDAVLNSIPAEDNAD